VRARQPLDATVLWGVAAVACWGVMAWLGVVMFNATPRIAAFDLDLLVNAGRAVAAGQQPYDPSILQGIPPDAFGLFYSYPPIVGQVFALLSGLPLGALAIALAALGVGGVAGVSGRLRDRLGAPTSTRVVVAGTIAVSAMALPMIVAVLFGNLDALFPALYGLVLVAAISPLERDRVVGGYALALGALTKVYPAALGLWFVVRFVRERATLRPVAARARLVPIIAAAVAAAAVLGVSVGIFGLGPWEDYATVASTAARAEIVDHRNVAPAAQLALWLGADSGTARLLHLPVVAAAVLAIALAAWRVRDPLESFAIGATASLFVLPISWVHYPAVLIPFGVAAVIRVTDTRARARIAGTLAAALLVAAVSILWLPILWLAIGLALVAVHWSAGAARSDAPSAPSGAAAANRFIAPAAGAAVG
jgi:hypothetical protein